MTNKRILKSHMAMKGMTNGVLAKHLGLSRQSVSYKINNRRDFKTREIEAIAKLLDLTAEDIMLIFFADTVDNKST